MFNFRPDKRWFGFDVDPLEESPGFIMNANGTARDGSSGDAMFSFQPGQDVPGLHNFRPPEEFVPGFHLNADGSTGGASTPPVQPYPNVGGIPSSPFDRPGLDIDAFTSVGDGTLPPYLTFARQLFSKSPLSGLPSIPGAATNGLPLGVAPQVDSGDDSRPLPASFSYTANPTALPTRLVPTPANGTSTIDLGLRRGGALSEWPTSDGMQSTTGQAADPNIVRVGDSDSATPADDTQIAQAPERSTSKLRIDPSPGVEVVLPDKSTIPDPQSPTGHLMAPTADLNEVAAAGRQAKEMLDKLSVFPPAYLAYLAGTLGTNVAHGGTFDYQRQGNMVTGYTHLPQFVKVSNLNVGLFAQQAGLTLEQTLFIAGEFARARSSNADEKEGLSRTQREFITLGHKIGASGMFDRPAR